ncbi:MAG: hypothetical protein HYU67_06530 [Flavobacteriia bacterium]|nr:hypothetical protein [Flavobacteriia bacterium]
MKWINIFLISLSIIVNSCTKNPLDVVPQNKKLPISFIRLDSIIRNSNKEEIKKFLFKIQIKHQEIIQYQLQYCLGIGSIIDSSTLNGIELFKKDPYISRLENVIQKNFSSLNEIQKKVKNGFLYLNYHFPESSLPQSIFFINSFFSSNVYVGEKDIAIGLERYLGPNEQVIKELPSKEFHSWIKNRMLRIYLERDVLSAWILTHLVKEDNEHFASQMIRWGKIHYFTEASFPAMEKELILRYTKEQFVWCEKNEKEIWKHLVKYNLLFSKNVRDISNFMNDAPFTSGLDKNSPDRVGQYLGWKIIHSFMKQHPKTPLKKLLKLPFNEIMKNYEQ